MKFQWQVQYIDLWTFMTFRFKQKKKLFRTCLFRRILALVVATGQADHPESPGIFVNEEVCCGEQLCNKPGLIEMRSLLSSTAGPQVQLDFETLKTLINIIFILVQFRRLSILNQIKIVIIILLNQNAFKTMNVSKVKYKNPQLLCRYVCTTW